MELLKKNKKNTDSNFLIHILAREFPIRNAELHGIARNSAELCATVFILRGIVRNCTELRATVRIVLILRGIVRNCADCAELHGITRKLQSPQLQVKSTWVGYPNLSVTRSQYFCVANRGIELWFPAYDLRAYDLALAHGNVIPTTMNYILSEWKYFDLDQNSVFEINSPTKKSKSSFNW